MNRKGFTLIELVVTIIILSIILVIVAPNIKDAYKNSKLKNEQVFINRLSTIIDSYVKLNINTIGFTKVGTANKQHQNSEYSVDIYSGKIDGEQITFNNIINEKLISEDDFKNAGNKDVQCSVNAEIEVYRDSDFVYCYKVKAPSLNCVTEDYIKSICIEENETCNVIDTCIWSK